MIVVYQEKSGLEKEKIIELLDAETWMTADEAIAYGFADEIEETKKIAASLDGKFLTINGQKFDLSKYKNLPKISSSIIKDGVVPSDVSREKAPEDEPWEKPTLSDFTDESWDDLSDTEKRKIAGHFAWAKEMPPDKFGDLKFGHHRPADGAVVWRGVAAAAARLDQSDIPEEDKTKVRSHLGSHYRQFEKEPPWEAKKAQNIKSEGRTISAANEQKIVQSRDLLNEILDQLSKNDTDGTTTQSSNRIQTPVDLYTRQIQVNKNKIRRAK
jgi:ATP-dependent Clp protease protease subunit